MSTAKEALVVVSSDIIISGGDYRQSSDEVNYSLCLFPSRRFHGFLLIVGAFVCATASLYYLIWIFPGDYSKWRIFLLMLILIAFISAIYWGSVLVTAPSYNQNSMQGEGLRKAWHDRTRRRSRTAGVTVESGLRRWRVCVSGCALLIALQAKYSKYEPSNEVKREIREWRG